LCVNTR